MIKVGIAGIPVRAKDRGTLEGMRCLKEIGLEAMEVQFVRNVYMKPKAADEAGALAKELGLRLSVHCPYYVNLTSKNLETQEKSKRWILDSARIAGHLGAHIAVFHPARDKDLDTVVSHMEEVVSTLKDEKINVKAGLETTGDLKEFGGIDDIMAVLKAVKGTDIVLDFAHIHSRGDGCLKIIEDFESVFNELKPVKTNDFHIHFSGIEYKDRREVRHLPISEGPDFSLLAEVLRERKVNATIICESPLMEEDALTMRRLL